LDSTIAPAGIDLLWVRNNPEWNNSLLVGSLKVRVRVLKLSSDWKTWYKGRKGKTVAFNRQFEG